MLKDIIIAWLNGAEIEWKNPYIKSKWHPLLKYTEGAQVYFGAENRYRIKPKEPDYSAIYIEKWEAYEPSAPISRLSAHAYAVKAVVDAAKQWQKENGSV